MKIIKKLLILLLCAGLLLSSSEIYAHAGRNHRGGGHHTENHVDGHNYNHYYCDGNPAHLHQNGICPYASAPSADNQNYSQNASDNTKSSANKNAAKVRKIQKRLNKLGYKCGKADGICDKKTRKAIKRYQNDNNLKAHGKINRRLCKKLNLN